MIDPDELRTWLLQEIDDADLDAPDDYTRRFVCGCIDSYLRTGRRFGALTPEDDQMIVALLESGQKSN